MNAMNTNSSPRTGEDAHTGLSEGDTAYLLEMSKGHIAKMEAQNAALVAALEALNNAVVKLYNSGAISDRDFPLFRVEQADAALRDARKP